MKNTVTETERFDRAIQFEAQNFDESKSQTEMTLEYIEKFGSITPLEALSAFGCFRLSARIADLREAGHAIETDIHEGKKRYAIYRLADEEEVNG